MLFDDLRKSLPDSKECLEHPPASVELVETRLHMDNAVYPVLTLPPEITCEIFLQCVESEETSRSRLSPAFAPLLLIQICRSWRLIALAAPPLWNSVGLTLRFSRDDRSRYRLQSIPGLLPSLWEQLTMFTAKELRIEDILRVLNACPRLQKCAIFVSTLGEELPPPRPLVVHTALAELHLCRAISQVVRLLDLPALRVLLIDGAVRNGPDFPPFLARCAGSLREFRSRQYRIGPDGVSLAWFRILENLETVTLHDPALDLLRPFLCALDRTVDASFLPYLRRLHITDRFHTVDAPVVRALQSRATDTDGGAAKLESLRLCVSRSVHGPRMHWSEVGPVDWDALLDLGQGGMDLHVGSQDENLLYEWWDWDSE
ncbi:hypothetical protein B0H15DRAFT_928505 [Mycena belliarum]|uniref:F-box domain-containing protein n=1 Tax=Mycena belliarum TaxID=1033014 RepID=A0AAD6XUQ0_9AGAR|nr:hypothetical protein B0H15DRAFT_928505 [Mycena belliae]